MTWKPAMGTVCSRTQHQKLPAARIQTPDGDNGGGDSVARLVTQDHALVDSRLFLTEGRVRSNSCEMAENAHGVPGTWKIREMEMVFQHQPRAERKGMQRNNKCPKWKPNIKKKIDIYKRVSATTASPTRDTEEELSQIQAETPANGWPPVAEKDSGNKNTSPDGGGMSSRRGRKRPGGLRVSRSRGTY